MKKIISAVFMAAAAAALIYAQDYIQGVPKTGPGSWTVSQKKMSARLDYDAVKLRNHGPIPRVVEHDTSFAADIEEYVKLNTYGVMMISAQCRDPRELPFKSVYLKIAEKKFPLVLLHSKNVGPGSEISEKIFGPNRMDFYYLIPYGYTKLKAELRIDWGKNREGFLLNKYPAGFVLRFVNSRMGIKPSKERKIDLETFKKFLIREFEFAENDALEAEKNLQKTGL